MVLFVSLIQETHAGVLGWVGRGGKTYVFACIKDVLAYCGGFVAGFLCLALLGGVGGGVLDVLADGRGRVGELVGGGLGVTWLVED